MVRGAAGWQLIGAKSAQTLNREFFQHLHSLALGPDPAGTLGLALSSKGIPETLEVRVPAWGPPCSGFRRGFTSTRRNDASL
jgi:hypothetical protein